jgi:RNA polymerase primary sigma factor
MRQLKISKQITERGSIALDKYFNEINTLEMISQEEEVELARLIKSGADLDSAAFKKMTEANLRFVVSVAKQYAHWGGKKQSLPDLINAGNEGLMKAVKRFDDSRGFKFISYGVWWIRQNILQYLSDYGRSIHLPSNKVGLLNKVNTASSKLEQRLERTPTSSEIADFINEESLAKSQKLYISPQDIDDLQIIGSTPSSLDAKLSEDGDGSFIDLIKSDGIDNVQDTLKTLDLQSTIKRIFSNRLSPKEQDILIDYFGLFNTPQKSLEEIGDKHELTRERVRQIKEKAIRKIKHSSSAKIIKEYV